MGATGEVRTWTFVVLLLVTNYLSHWQCNHHPLYFSEIYLQLCQGRRHLENSTPPLVGNARGDRHGQSHH